MTNLEHQIALWHTNTFGEEARLPATYRKLCEEVGELGEALMLGDSRKIHEEAGDVGILLAHIVRAGCPSCPSLSHAIACALEKIERRCYEAKRRERSSLTTFDG